MIKIVDLVTKGDYDGPECMLVTTYDTYIFSLSLALYHL